MGNLMALTPEFLQIGHIFVNKNPLAIGNEDRTKKLLRNYP